jgi:hypothetical protein
MATTWRLHEQNPNDTIGGGGSLTTGNRPDLDHKGPWVHFFRASTEHDGSPYAVVSLQELREIVAQAEHEEVLGGGDVHPLRETKRNLVEA